MAGADGTRVLVSMRFWYVCYLLDWVWL